MAHSVEERGGTCDHRGRMRPAALPGLAIVVLAVACDPAGTTSTIAPTAPTDAVGPASPLTLQLDVERVSAMMQAMDHDIAVVAFDCIDLVQECSQPRAPGCTSPLQLELVPIGP